MEGKTAGIKRRISLGVFQAFKPCARFLEVLRGSRRAEAPCFLLILLASSKNVVSASLGPGPLKQREPGQLSFGTPKGCPRPAFFGRAGPGGNCALPNLAVGRSPPKPLVFTQPPGPRPPKRKDRHRNRCPKRVGFSVSLCSSEFYLWASF